MDVLEVPETGQGLRSWIRIDASGYSQVIEMDKLSIIRSCGISTRDLRILDPLFVYPTTILGREKAIVANLEKIRCIITAEEVLLLNSLDRNVLQYVMEIQKRLRTRNQIIINGERFMDPNPSASSTRSFRTQSSHTPFEFRALAVALEVVSGSLDSEASALETEAYSLLDELTSQINTANLERVRGLKTRLLALNRRIHKIRDEIEKIMDNHEDMMEMYLTVKKRKMESAAASLICEDEYEYEYDDGQYLLTNMSSPSVDADSRGVAGNQIRNRHKMKMSTAMSSENTAKSVEELESLLEAYFVVVDSILNKLIALKEYIDDTENFINFKLNNLRNRLIQFELLLTSATFVLAIFGIVIGIFGINFPVPLFSNSRTIKLTLIFTSVCAVLLYCALVFFFKWRRVLLL